MNAWQSSGLIQPLLLSGWGGCTWGGAGAVAEDAGPSLWGPWGEPWGTGGMDAVQPPSSQCPLLLAWPWDGSSLFG